MHWLPWGASEAHIIPGTICANNEFLLRLFHWLRKKHTAGEEIGFSLSSNLKIIDIPTFRVFNEKEEKNPCRTLFLHYSPPFGS